MRNENNYSAAREDIFKNCEMMSNTKIVKKVPISGLALLTDSFTFNFISLMSK